jgi:hypothetical protein
MVVGASGLVLLLQRDGAETELAMAPAAVGLIGLIALGARRPGPVLLVLLGFVPLQVALLAGLYSAGTPEGIVRGLGFLKEACVAALLLAALRMQVRGSPQRGTRLWALSFVVLATAFLLASFLVSGVLDDIPVAARALGWRTECLGLIALLALSRIDLHVAWRRRALSVVVVTGVVMGAGAIWNGLLPVSFDAFSRSVLHVRRFQADVLGAGSGSGSILVPTSEGGVLAYRAGSFLYNPLTCSFYLLLPFGVLAARLASRTRPRDLAAFVVVSAGLLMTGTRSSILAALVAGAVLLLGVRRAAAGARVAAVAAVLLILIGGSLGSSFRARLSAASSGQDYSSQQHAALTRQALRDVVENPLGRGLGTSPGIGARFDVSTRVTAENAYLQVAVETGAFGVALFGATLATAIAAGWRRRDQPVGGAVLVSGVALAVSGLFLHTWEDFSVSLSYWSLVGLMLAVDDPHVAERSSAKWRSTESCQV